MPGPDLKPTSTAAARAQAPVTYVASRQSRARRDQLVYLSMAVILLIGIFFIQPELNRQRAKLVPVDKTQQVGDLLIQFPRLTLGGFRGLLAMTLWEDAESDKNHHRWRPLETDYNMIAALEPYFGSAYIFNAWNQSYNLSAQFHSMQTKYKWVLDGLVYLYKGEHYVPNDADMIMEEANDYFLKLGTSFERKYYCARWRFDIAHNYEYIPGKINPALSTLGEVHFLVSRPQFKAKWLPPRTGKGPLGHGVEIDGIHYRYGLSPFYFAYVEYKRALAQPVPPDTQGLQVLESWPPMCLRLWCRDDVYYAQRLAYRIFSVPQKDFTRHFPQRIEEIHDCYRNVSINAPRAILAFTHYLAKFPDQWGVHHQHRAEVRYYQALALAEGKLFNALVAWQNNDRRYRLGDQADQLMAQAETLFENAKVAYNHWLNIAYPPMANGMPNPSLGDELKHRNALDVRIAGIEAFRRTAAAHKKPDMNFLSPQTLSYSD